MKDKVKELMNIPKKHTLRHYIRLVGALYGEPEGTLAQYTDEQVEANADNLDKAIDCFKGLLPPEHLQRIVATELEAARQAKK